MNDKKKILFVVAEFWQAGGERQTFEIISNLIAENVEIEILSLRNLNSEISKDDYYYHKYIDLKIKIHFLNDVQSTNTPTIKQRIFNKFKIKDLPLQNQPLIDFFFPFQKVFFMGEYTLPIVERFLNETIIEKSFVFIQFSIFQVPENYNRFDKNKSYNFISGFKDAEIEIELAEFENYNHFYFPLSISIGGNPKYLNWENKIKKIGIFTRITANKPLDVFFYALHLLLSEGEKIELHIFGDCPEDMKIILNCIDYLKIDKAVFFHGHQTNMKEVAIESKIDLVWFHSYYGAPGGYASFDLASLGIPQLFWNFTPEFDISKQINNWPIFNNLKEFVLSTKNNLKDDSKRLDISDFQFNTIKIERDIVNHIDTLKKIIFNTILKE